MATIKNLSLSHIKKQDAKKFKEKKQVLLDDGTVKVDVDVTFRTSKKNQVVADLIKLIQEKVKKNESVTGESISAAMLSLIIKQFTSIDVKSLNTLDDYVEMFIIMTDNNYISPIIDSFDKTELQSMIDYVNEQLDKWNVEVRKILEEIRTNEGVNNGTELQ
ncbi:hypothetical protein EDM57_21000 [Brevibacillus gelatini]|uniref:Uncharacterized protein n=1 Tax=Brevibacillus gelatini TaxID=1655277 RepID=A0A3M8AN90_9BACL|nr:hypothetical protein [Brevibacillus gelatini]RNB52668.1 hypothetical protein EDM57_21000 [Brevibacillus gelatini]